MSGHHYKKLFVIEGIYTDEGDEEKPGEDHDGHQKDTGAPLEIYSDFQILPLRTRVTLRREECYEKRCWKV